MEERQKPPLGRLLWKIRWSYPAACSAADQTYFSAGLGPSFSASFSVILADLPVSVRR